ncbi:MAG TPA: PEP-CTERM sorting domain-containing protein [Burkholderiales bacterium]|nr:PEP-CTERM sorting domain-containing protein [Burkholderiales bacterium]
MHQRYLAAIGSAVFIAFAANSYAACVSISPNPNPAGHTVNNVAANGCSDDYQNNGTLNNAGTIATDTLGNDGTLNNSGQIKYNALSNNGVLNNSGALPGSSFSNTGVTNNAGIINSNSVQNTGTLLNAGAIIGTGNVNQNGGTLVNNGLIVENKVNVNGGALQGNGIVVAPVIVNGGTINAGDMGAGTGTLTIDGKLSFNSGVLLTEISGTSAGSFDLLKVTDKASFLGGVLEFSFLDGYLPDVGDSWLFLTADGGVSGWEGLTREFLGVPSNYLFDVQAANGGLVLSVAAVPEPETYAMMIAGLGFLTFVVRRKKSASFQGFAA